MTKIILILTIIMCSGCGSIASIREPGPGERITVIVQKETVGSDPVPHQVRGS
jgi:uncharacterized protein YceK